MQKLLVTILIACAVTGTSTPAGAGLFSAKGAVIAILAGELFVGEAEGHLSGSGTLAIRSQKDAALTCVGEFTSSEELGGMGKLRCSDASTATFTFQRLTVLRGHGGGTTSRGSMSFTYGLKAEEALPYLKLPAGKKLKNNGAELVLVAASE